MTTVAPSESSNHNKRDVTLMSKRIHLVIAMLLLTAAAIAQNASPNVRPRAANLGLKVGVLPTGTLNAITDVAGVEVGHTTLIRADDVRTGVTAVLPHSGNLYREKVPGAIFVGNGFGRLAGYTQVEEMGDIETPILLTNTTSVANLREQQSSSLAYFDTFFLFAVIAVALIVLVFFMRRSVAEKGAHVAAE